RLSLRSKVRSPAGQVYRLWTLDFGLATRQAEPSPLPRAPLARVEQVAQAVADQVQAQDGHADGEAGEDGDPRRPLEVGAGVTAEHRAPGRRRRRRSQAEEAQR